ncbi:SDR family NAD(P)-dependent oxidoreductase [Gynuella sunshinyii]|uniref:Polyketide synthase modules-related protein n=1 Tax=Gynuella sunshinyii YC6258 TaxID=1445510 RepID=A0A0C5VZ60_9GAMM|nr:SDR family NAD(P)-dependent oxidoreductase [Gynuella sunshinyii]AJQ95704.1 polyketide synthase modules-related protein [Gynuella sunshinyii YC6258]
MTHNTMLFDQTVSYFRHAIADIVQASVAEIDPAEALEKYGIDSILIAQLTDTLSEVLEDISGTLFFEYQTIDAISEHLVSTQPQALQRLLGLTAASAPAELTDPQAPQAKTVTAANQASPAAVPISIPLKGQAPAPTAPQPVTAAPAAVSTSRLLEQTVQYFRHAIGDIIRLPAGEIDPSEALEKYGIDSILIAQLTDSLSEVLDDISGTLFFEFQTIDALSEHFVRTQPDNLKRLLGLETQSVHQSPVEITAEQPSQPMTMTPVSRVSQSATVTDVQKTAEPIAIIGLTGRYPQAANLDEYWQNLASGRNCIVEIPPDRWSINGFFEPDRLLAQEKGRSYSKWGGFMDRHAEFDPLFFGISPREAINIDPQERLFLQSCWHTLEDAGYTRERLTQRHQRRVGVFVGISKTGFELYGPALWAKGQPYFPHTSFSSVANRVSYFLDLQGPSMPIDTMCSSSLTAIHEACEYLRRGDCEMALAGGVNVYSHPASYVELCSAQMLSAEGACKSFGDQGDGFVPGEGVGSVLLKPLSRAEADGDLIYALIRGSGINHGGKTNGYTVPNPTAQAALIRQTLDRAGVDARSVSYVEAHGTGTRLGDPIEVAGLVQAFKPDLKDDDRGQFCALGSVKSNIGHLEAAAGIAGLSKIVLQLQHGQLVPSLHAATLNPAIAFAQTPFAVQQTLADWPRPQLAVDGDLRECPRIAGLSSFGAGGSNAHLIIEEYSGPLTRQQPSRPSSDQPAMVIVSAQDEAHLLEWTRQLLAFVQQHSEVSVSDMAYSLQTGREAMEERLGIVARDRNVLIQKLQACIQGQKNIVDVYRGSVQANRDTMMTFNRDGDFRETVKKWLQQGKYSQVVELWVKGLNVDWEGFHQQAGFDARRVPVPLYPFAHERYWPDHSETGVASSSAERYLHPLLHRNTSTFARQSFSSTFHGEEFFLSDHRVGGQRVLPGVAYLEMARAAFAIAADANEHPELAIEVRQSLWMRPVVVADAPVTVDIQFKTRADGQVRYEISSDAATLHSQGQVAFVSADRPEALDLDQLRGRCQTATISAEQCYDVYQAIGIEYGPAHRGIEEIRVGRQQDRIEVLAKLTLPAALVAGSTDFQLHPALMDSALQATIAFALARQAAGEKGDTRPALPFSLDQLTVFSPSTPSMWVWIRDSAGSAPGGQGGILKHDIDLCDDHGNVLISLRGFMSKTQGNSVQEGYANTLQPVWTPLPQNIERPAVDPIAGGMVVIGGVSAPWSEIRDQLPQAQTFVMTGQTNEQALADYFSGLETLTRIIWLADTFDTTAGDIDSLACYDSVYCCFTTIRVLSQLDYRARSLQWTVITCAGQAINAGERIDPVQAGLHGLVGTMAQEFGRWQVQLLDVDIAALPLWAGRSPLRISELLSMPFTAEGRSLAYRQTDQQWLHQTLQPCDLMPQETAYRNGGVYVVIGGAGGIGQAWSEYLIRHYRARIVWLGRRALNDDIQQQLDALAVFGPAPVYLQADATRHEDMVRAHEQILQRFGGIHGIVHAAIDVKDQMLERMEAEDFRNGWRPKADTCVNIARVFAEDQLDFALFFSSVVAFSRAPGQSNYTAGCLFKDAFAHWLAQHWRCSVKVINWGYWGSVGVAAGADYQTRMTAAGLASIEADEAMEVLNQFMASSLPQLAFVKTLAPMAPENTAVTEVASVDIGTEAESVVIDEVDPRSGGNVRERAIRYFQQAIGTIVGLAPHQINPSASFDSYGIDSISVARLTDTLNDVFDNVSTTIFFEYTHIEALVDYFLDAQPTQLSKLVGEPQNSKAARAAPVQAAKTTTPETRFAQPLVPSIAATTAKPQSVAHEAIAVIGMSGRYPGAANLDEYWRNLLEGRQCFNDVPADRWPLEGFYEADPLQALEQGKSYCKSAGFIDGFADFDPLFFGISPRDAINMDPQERLFMQSCWETCEDGGYTRERLAQQHDHQVGVFVGISKTGFDLYGPVLWAEGKTAFPYTSFSSVANRVSYFMDLQGPSMPVDTMCSSSLTAIHEACEHLRRGDCELAIAGGVNLYVHPASFVLLCSSQMLSTDSQKLSFAEGASGFVPGEGVGSLLLKPLSRAEQDGDRIYATIKHSGINHDGRSNGYFMPNPTAQTRMMERNFRDAGIDPRSISYVEAAANGSYLGDAIEVAALTRAFSAFTPDKGFCALGTVKPNIGHLEAASGISQITKVILQLWHRQLVPTIRPENINRNIQFESTPFFLQPEAQPWQQPTAVVNGTEMELPRRATVSSFGAGGSNAHFILEEYLSPVMVAEDQDDDESRLFLFSAQSRQQLLELSTRMLDFVRSAESISLRRLSYTLQVCREHMDYRLAIVANDKEVLISALAAFTQEQELPAGVAGSIVSGYPDTHNDAIKALLSGAMEQTLVDALMTENNPDKLAVYWTQGGNIPWIKRYPGKPPVLLSLPAYPFERRRCWINSEDAAPTMQQSQVEHPSMAMPAVQQSIVAIIGELLGIDAVDLDCNRPLKQYGFDSMQAIQLLQKIQYHLAPDVDPERLRSCETITDIIGIMPDITRNESMIKVSRIKRYPELIRLSRNMSGHPVFWIHSAFGGVEQYAGLATTFERPFYGIQARGSNMDKSPLHGIEAMALYYVQLIRSIQPEGPYDLGGYSLGGILAYEVARQLQEMDETVNSIVMLDSMALSSEGHRLLAELDEPGYQKNQYFRAVNLALTAALDDQQDYQQKLIHRRELNLDLDDEAFLQQLIELAQARGLQQSEQQLRQWMEKNVEVRSAYELERYHYPALPKPEQPKGLYLRNENGLLFGELANYFLISGGEQTSMKDTKYWQSFETGINQFEVIDVAAPNHMSMLSDPTALETIAAHCQQFYRQTVLQ